MKDYLKEIQSIELALWFVSKCLPVTHKLYIETKKLTDEKRSKMQSKIFNEKVNNVLEIAPTIVKIVEPQSITETPRNETVRKKLKRRMSLQSLKTVDLDKKKEKKDNNNEKEEPEVFNDKYLTIIHRKPTY